MTSESHKNKEDDFEAYIIKYNSGKFHENIYLIWFTDNDLNSTDKLLTLKNGKIFYTNNLENLHQELHQIKDEIENSEQIICWINRERQNNSNKNSDDIFYNTNWLINQIEQDNFSIETIELYANFINLFGDFARQNSKNKYLEQYENNETIKYLWTYYYEAIFWPRFNDKKKFQNTKLPMLEIDKVELKIKLREIIDEFDKKIKN